MGARLMNAKKKARRRRHKGQRDAQVAAAPAQNEQTGTRKPVSRAR